MFYEILFFILFIGFFYFFGKKQSGNFKFYLPIAFCIKLTFGILCTLLFSNLYGATNLQADADIFINDSKILLHVYSVNKSDFFHLIFSSNDYLVNTYLLETTHWDSSYNFLINDSRFIIRFHALIGLISLGEITIHLMFLNALSLLGIFFINQHIERHSLVKSATRFFILLLAPNILFWSSSLLKEPFIMFAFGIIALGLSSTSIFKKILLYILAFWLLQNVKIYIAFCTLIFILLFTFFKYTRPKTALYTLVGLTFFFVGLILTNTGQPIVERISSQQFDFNNIGKGGVYLRADTCIYVIPEKYMNALHFDGDSVFLNKKIIGEYLPEGSRQEARTCIITPNQKAWEYCDAGKRSQSYIKTTLILNSGTQLLKNIPEALSIVFLRPFITDPPYNNKMKWFSLLDSYLILSFSIVTFLFRRKINRTEKNLIFALFLSSFILSLLIGLTTPVLGAVIRYKIPVQFVQLIIGLILIDTSRISRIKLVKKYKSK